MHTTVYGLRPDIESVVHAHPPVSTGFATAGTTLNLALLPEVMIGLGCVPLADYGLPGTPALTEPMLPLIPKYDALHDGQSRRGLLRGRRFQGVLQDGDAGAFRAHPTGRGTGGRAQGAAARGSGQAVRFAHAIRRKAIAPGEPGCPVRGRRIVRPRAAANEEHFYVTREELVRLVEEALRARGVA